MIKKVAKSLRASIGRLWIGNVFESKFINKRNSVNPPPIFIVGLPRAGSTLLYQLIVENFNTTYFSNLVSVFVSYPSLMTYLTKYFQNSAQLNSYKSDYGVTPGFFSPSEAGGIYKYWFTKEGEEKDRRIKQTCEKISDIYSRPFIWKNLNLSEEIPRLKFFFPEALFINIERDLKYVVQSIYIAIKKGHSIDIAGFANIVNNDFLLKNVTKEAIYFEQYIRDSLNGEATNHCTVKYEKLCKDYHEILQIIKESYTTKEYSLKRSDKVKKPVINVGNKKALDSRNWRLLKLYLNEYQIAD